MSLKGYDEWKLSTPDYYEQDDIVAGKCTFSGDDLFHGESVYYDSREGNYFKNKEHFKRWLIRNINDEVDYYIDLLEKEKDTYETVIETEEEDD